MTRLWVRRSATPSTTMTTRQRGPQPRPDCRRCGCLRWPCWTTLDVPKNAEPLSSRARHSSRAREESRSRSLGQPPPVGHKPGFGKLGTAVVELGGAHRRTTRRGRASRCGSDSTGLPRGDSTTGSSTELTVGGITSRSWPSSTASRLRSAGLADTSVATPALAYLMRGSDVSIAILAVEGCSRLVLVLVSFVIVQRSSATAVDWSV
jgi:hypothetical protein